MPNNLHDLFLGTKFNSHPHACIIYDDLLHYRKVASYFILDGLNKNEKCLMAVDEYHPDSIREDFERAGVDIDSYLEDGNLTLIDVKSSYSKNGGFDPDSTIKIWQKECNKAISEGYNGLRIVGEATFSLGNPDLVDKLIYYENIMNEVLFNKFPFKSLCVYNRKLYPLEIIKTAISAHPVLFYNDKLFRENIHYIPPEIYFKDKNMRDEIDIMLKNIQRNNDNLVALKDSEEKYRTLFNTFPLGIAVSDHIGRIVESNAMAEKLLGLPKNEHEKRRIDGVQWRIIRPDKTRMPADEYASVRALKEKRQIENVEMGIVKTDTDTTWINVSAAPLHLEKYGVVVTYNDITARKKAEQEYKTLFREMLDGFALHEIICDDSGTPVDYRFLDINPAFERMTGIKAEHVVGRTVMDVLPGTEIYWIETYGTVALSGDPITFENYSAEIEKHFEVTAFSPAPGQVACIFQDITERKRAEAERDVLQTQLSQAQKMESVGRLAGGVAHDFNNMLGVILGHTELALVQADENHDLYSDLKEIQKAAKRSADITKQLLAFARKQTIAPRQLDLNDTVESMLNMLRRLIGEDIDLVWQPSAHLWPVKMDPSQIDQILANLCINARDAIDGVGKLTIETGRKTFDEEYCSEHLGFIPGDFVLLAVSDNGCGMDKDILDNLFEPFFTTKDVGKGTGLGLATIYGIVKQNNGFINVYSEPGQGSTFKIYLPRLVAEEDTDKVVPVENAATGGTETILLVEDEPTILRMTRMMLERKGYSVLPATTPGEAIDLAKTNADEIHLLMTDVVMPEMNGRDLAGQINDLYPDIRLLFMSGYTSNVIAHHGVLDDGVAFIQKPFSMADMTMKVREVLDIAPDKNQG